jgi:hypothetical protein
VNAGYITRYKLLEDHPREQQQAISRAVFAALGGLRAETSLNESGLAAKRFDKIFRNICRFRSTLTQA